MSDASCSDVVRFGGDVGLAPQELRGGLNAHLADCRDCASYASQIATTRDVLRRRVGRHPARGDVPVSPASPPSADAGAMRSALLARAELLDPANAEDLVQQALATGLALQRRDSRPRGIAELTTIMHALGDARARFDGRVLPAVDLTAAERAREDSLEGLDPDADEPELFYPDLYPGGSDLGGWVDRPFSWKTSADIIGPEGSDSEDEVYETVDKALGELPEPLGDLMVLVDIQGSSLSAAAQMVGLDAASAAAALARARNHVRGRLDAYMLAAH